MSEVPPRDLLSQVELVRRVMRATDARIEGLSVELFWREANSVEVQRWSWELRQWTEIVRLCAEVERLRGHVGLGMSDKSGEP